MFAVDRILFPPECRAFLCRQGLLLVVRKKRVNLNTEMDIKREQPVFDLLELVLGEDFISKVFGLWND